MKPWKTYTNTFPICGKNLEVKTEIFCEQDECISLEAVICDAEDAAKITRELERGELMIANVFVRVSYAGFKGTDSLGGVYVYSPDDVSETLVVHDMEQNAREDLERNMREQYAALKAIFEGGSK